MHTSGVAAVRRVVNVARRRLLAGSISGLIAGTALALGLNNTALGLVLGVLVGIAYAALSPASSALSVENVFTAAALGFPLWTVLTTILVPVLSGRAPQWSAEDMRMLLPGLVGWIVYGALVGVLLPFVSSALSKLGDLEVTTPTLETQPVRIVILGGGFAGVATAESLESEFGADLNVNFTLVSESNALLFTPMLAEVAGSSLEPSHISSPLRTSLHRTNVVRARVTGVDFDGCVVIAEAGDAQPLKIPYDHLVFALGSKANYFGNANVQKHSFDFKSLLDAIRIRNRVINMFEQSDAEEDNCLRREMLTFVIAGGGFAGAELAGALNDFARGILADYPRLHPDDIEVIVVHPRDVILPELSASLRETTRGGTWNCAEFVLSWGDGCWMPARAASN
jgi:NADH:ubiquinone reductase (H+-translocating)